MSAQNCEGSPAPADKETVRIGMARERWIERSPPVQVAITDGVLTSPHNDYSGFTMRLGEALGSRSPEFLSEALVALDRALRSRNALSATEQQLNAGIALVAAVAPENELEAALAVQIAAGHALTTDMLGRAAMADSIDQIQAYGNLAVKLQRTLTGQIEALARMRGKGQQTVRVEHVTVAAGAQAVIGDIHHHRQAGGGPSAETSAQPYGTTNGTTAPKERTALPSPDPSRNGVPIPRDAERAVPHTRGAQSGRANGKPKRIQARDV